jgi:acid stress chaperone HdeB
MLKKLALAAGVLLTATLPLRAEVIDLATVKCSDLATMSDEEGQFLMVWLYGYYGGKDGDTTIDTDSGDAVGKAIGEACAATPEVGLLTVVNKLVEEN